MVEGRDDGGKRRRMTKGHDGDVEGRRMVEGRDATTEGRDATTRRDYDHDEEVDARCDVYSFGLLTLELITGKHLGDLISSLSLSSSFSSSTSTVHGILLKDVLDQRLLPPKNQVAEQVVMVAKLAFACLPIHCLGQP
ncbi:putative leucine-rich repeat receptor-like protein kinase [Camellia lanceoleosa]|uniref:Leucine-rich repeat receptor-like protein kinase n=1 Tax=Camellia lanceoleosa TaxID=1840588 RepID=A0ACC0I349_9ERIC|nr:putative leucine-rich repeat receptor-like protein kinase [Camellia lanceoleosa]